MFLSMVGRTCDHSHGPSLLVLKLHPGSVSEKSWSGNHRTLQAWLSVTPKLDPKGDQSVAFLWNSSLREVNLHAQRTIEYDL